MRRKDGEIVAKRTPPKYPDLSPAEKERVDCLLGVMRDKSQPIRAQLDAAKEAMPYFHDEIPQDVVVNVKPHSRQ